MKIGIIGMAYGSPENIEQTLSPWINARDEKLDGHEFVISVASLPFKQYKDINSFEEDDITYKMLETLIAYEKIDYLITGPKYISEIEARNITMAPLLLQDFIKNKDKTITMISKCDYIWQVDLTDEFYNSKEISKIIKFIESNPSICWFKGCLKNYVFEKNTYLENPFNPARIYKVKYKDYKLTGFYDDNNCFYKDTLEQSFKDYVLSYLTIPKNVSWIPHYSWLNNEKSKKKIAYQNSRGWDCSYKWNEEKDCLEFNLDYYTKNRLSIPEILTD